MIIAVINKDEKGKYTGTVRVRGKTGTYERKQRLGRKDTGKIASLPQELKDEILSLRKLKYSGAKIKENIETMIQARLDERSSGKEFESGAVTSSGKLTITGQALTDWAAKRGVTGKTRKTVSQAEKEKDKQWTERWNKLNTEKAKVEVELQETKDAAEAQKKQKEGYLTQLRSCRQQLIQAKNL